jgi:TPR repeat protein
MKNTLFLKTIGCLLLMPLAAMEKPAKEEKTVSTTIIMPEQKNAVHSLAPLLEKVVIDANKKRLIISLPSEVENEKRLYTETIDIENTIDDIAALSLKDGIQDKWKQMLPYILVRVPTIDIIEVLKKKSNGANIPGKLAEYYEFDGIHDYFFKTKTYPTLEEYQKAKEQKWITPYRAPIKGDLKYFIIFPPFNKNHNTDFEYMCSEQDLVAENKSGTGMRQFIDASYATDRVTQLYAQIAISKMSQSMGFYEEAVVYNKWLAEHCNNKKEKTAASMRLFEMLMKGLGVEKDIDAAMGYLKIVAECSGNPQDIVNAQIVLAQHHFDNKNYEQTFKYATLLANQKNKKKERAEGQYLLAELLMHGWGTERDIKKVINLYLSLSKQNDNPGIRNHSNFRLGRMNLEGYGVKQNLDKAKEYFILVATEVTDDTDLQNKVISKLCELCLNPDIKEENKKAIDLIVDFTKHTNLLYHKAEIQAQLAEYYAHANRVKYDKDKALMFAHEVLKQNINKNIKLDMKILLAFMSMQEAIKVDDPNHISLEQAYEYLIQVSEQNDNLSKKAEAYQRLGDLCLFAQSKRNGYANALKYYTLGANQIDNLVAQAQSNYGLALLYSEGMGVAQDIQKTILYCNKALAVLQLPPKDKKKAEQLLKEAKQALRDKVAALQNKP